METTDRTSSAKSGGPPYFDIILPELADAESKVGVAYGQHVHWGYWEDPAAARQVSPQEYLEAATRLSELLLRQAQLRDGMSVLDIGCGLGGTLQLINSAHSDMVLRGINIDERQVEQARGLIVPVNGNQVDIVVGDAHVLPFEDSSMNAALAVECIFHFDRRQLFREAYRVLRKGCPLVVSDFVPRPLTKLLLGLAFRMGKKDSDQAFGKIDLNFGVAKYRKIATECGFSLAEEICITENTLPTYPFLIDLVESDQRAMQKPVTKPFLRSVKNLELLSKAGLLDYKILKFVRDQG